MATKSVLLKLEKELENGDLQTVEVNIKRMRTRQLTKTMKAVEKVVELVDESPELQQLIYDVYQGGRKFDESKYEGSGLSPEEIAEEKQRFIDMKDAQFAQSALKIFRILLGKIPDHIIDVMSAVTRIDVELILDQEPVRLFDIFEAILQTNDVMELIERGKGCSSNVQMILNGIFQKEADPVEETKRIPQQ